MYDIITRAQAVTLRAVGETLPSIHQQTGISTRQIANLHKQAMERGWSLGQPLRTAHVADAPRTGRPRKLRDGEERENLNESAAAAASGAEEPTLEQILANALAAENATVPSGNATGSGAARSVGGTPRAPTRAIGRLRGKAGARGRGRTSARAKPTASSRGGMNSASKGPGAASAGTDPEGGTASGGVKRRPGRPPRRPVPYNVRFLEINQVVYKQ